MKTKHSNYLVLLFLMFFGQIKAGIYPNYSQNIGVANLNNIGQTGYGGGTITINNDILTININASWPTSSYLKIGTVATLSISPALPNMDLGRLSSTPGSPLSNFAAKIENNSLVFYLTNSPSSYNGCYLNITKNLACTTAYTWYLDNDLDGLGDPLNFISDQCTKPNGNYVLDNSDNCPMIPGTSTNCTTLEASLQNQNSIRNVTYKTPTTTSISTPTINEANQNITYFNGLGYPVQKITYQSSKSGKDIVIPIEYDGFGRQTREYLPYASTQNNLNYINPLILVPNLITQYQTNYGTINNNPFNEKQLEDSPLNRTLQQAAPGNDWSLANNHTIKISYQTNIDNDVNNYVANTTWNTSNGLYDIVLTNTGGTGYYGANQLFKTITYDENSSANPLETSGSSVEFKNKEGQVILKRNYNAGNKHDTYYVYDKYGNLTYVIPPKASDLIGNTNGTSIQANITSSAIVNSGSSLQLTATNSITLSPGFQALAGSTFSAVIDNGMQDILNDLCYQYKYDSRNRLVEKKIPGKQWEFIVYDKLDRPVATGPANSPFNDINSSGWMITKYDAFNRPVYTGWMNSTAPTAAGRVSLQAAQNSTSLTVLNESKQTNGTIDGIAAYYSNVVAPTSFKLLTVNYYDNYTFPSTPNITVPVSVESQVVLGTNQVKGLTTASWTRVPTSSAETLGETVATFYDSKARPVLIYTINHLGGYTYTDSKLDFIGKTVYSITRHKRTNADTELLTKDAFTYSPQDRLLTHTHQINGGSIELIASNTYDELGQLISKKVGNTETLPTQNINYTYNIRGWLTNINDITALTKVGDPKDLFAFKINYNTPTLSISGVNVLFNGNIAETQWATDSDSGTIRAYGYRYDNLNRLEEAIYKKGSVLGNYNESMSYDKNGNIMHLTRYGSTNDSTQTLIDDLTYDYKNSNNSNQLIKTSDATPNNSNFLYEFKDSSSNTVDDYGYDANGNLTKDNNKNITEIIYNHLNLPTKITFGSTGNIVYIYNATGQKVQKIVNRTGVPNAVTTDYLGGYQYENSILKFFPTAEGYVESTGSSYKYVYQYKDHLGNIRLSYDNNKVIQEENNYYPFGLKQEGYNIAKNSTNDRLKYKYNGKELQDELGLNMYDYGARNYDPALAKWMNIDPLAELSTRYSPYAYCYNNPVRFIDPDGMYSTEEWKKDHGVKDSDLVTIYQAPPGEIDAEKNTTVYLNGTEKGTQVMAPNGKWINTGSKIREYTYSDGKTHDNQQKKAGVWSYTNKEGQWLWNNVKGKYVLNTSENGPGENTFPLFGPPGTTYAGGENPKYWRGGDDYSQPPQNLADYAGYLHDREYDKLGLIGKGGTSSPLSSGANRNLINNCRIILSMYGQKKIDPWTGAPVSKATMTTAYNIITAFNLIEEQKK